MTTEQSTFNVSARLVFAEEAPLVQATLAVRQKECEIHSKAGA